MGRRGRPRKFNKKRPLSGAQRRKLKRQKFKQDREKTYKSKDELWRDDLGTYEEFWRAAVDLYFIVKERAERFLDDDLMRYQKQKGVWRKITLFDLTCSYYAVQKVGEKGLSLDRLGQCFKMCGIGWHRKKGSDCLVLLIWCRLIQKVGNYSVGKVGNKYKDVYVDTIK